MATAQETWLRQHGAGERRLAKVFENYFSAQLKKISSAIARLRSPSVDDAADLFDADAEHEALMALLPVPLATLAATGAINVLQQLQTTTSRRRRKDTDFEVAVADELEDFEIPEHVREAIKTAIGELIEEDYWRDIQKTTQTSLTDVIRDGISEGLNNQQLTKRINTALGGAQKLRAKMIARTETTAMFNAGHQAAYDSLAEDGMIEGKTWLSLTDDRTRESHAKLNNKTVKASADFNVGGNKAPYPGHHSLPAEDRVNCRCTTVAAFAKDE